MERRDGHTISWILRVCGFGGIQVWHARHPVRSGIWMLHSPAWIRILVGKKGTNMQSKPKAGANTGRGYSTSTSTWTMLVFVIVRAPSLSSSTRRRCFRSPDSGPADVNLLCSQLMVLQLAAEHPFAEHPDIDWLWRIRAGHCWVFKLGVGPGL